MLVMIGDVCIEAIKNIRGPTVRIAGFYILQSRDARGGAFSIGAGRGRKSARRSGAGQGEDENPRGGPGRGGAKKRVNQLIQKFDKSA